MRPPACASDRIVETYRDHTSTCRRTHIYGQIRALADDRRDEGSLSLGRGVIVLAFGLGVIVAGVFFMGELL